jgi:hypothetical protein
LGVFGLHLARATGLTVRMLHYYDRLGLGRIGSACGTRCWR